MGTMEKHPLENIKFGIIPITSYRGCLVTKLIGGYSVFNKKCLTPKDVDMEIENAQKSLAKSIK